MEIDYYKTWNKGAKLNRKTPLASKKGLSPFGRKRKRRSREMSQMDVFMDIWDARPHKCENCGAEIQDPRAWNFAHVYTKGAHPGLALEPRNIALVCETCHHRDHNDPAFQWNEDIQRRADEAKREYYKQGE